MDLTTNSIIGLIIIIIVLITVIRDKNKEIEKYHKDWEFCKKILDECRANKKTKL
jgi:hypothetical protein